jgi:hypothetical protein
LLLITEIQANPYVLYTAETLTNSCEKIVENVGWKTAGVDFFSGTVARVSIHTYSIGTQATPRNQQYCVSSILSEVFVVDFLVVA